VENRGRALNAAIAAVLLGSWVLLASRPAQGIPLDQRLPSLFGGSLNTSVNRFSANDAQRVLLADRLQPLSSALAVARSQAPIPSASGAFRFAWDAEIDTFVRSDQSLGSGVAERAQTLGRGAGIVSMAYTHIDFDSFEGQPLSNLQSNQRAFSDAYLNRLNLSQSERAKFADDRLQTRLNLGLTLDQVFLTAAIGLADSLDMSMALSINRIHMQAAAAAEIVDPPPNDGTDKGNGTGQFATNQRGVIVGGGAGACSTPFHCASDGFSATAWGTGDLFLRGKWHFADTQFADLAVAGVLTLPTGNADDFLGFHDPTFTPWLIASKPFGRLSPHLNLGYAFRSEEDVSQAQWIAGADLMAFTWLTLNSDFLGFHDTNSTQTNDNVIQSAVGFKLNPFGQFVLAGTFQFPLNSDGLRADVIYTGQVEWTF
jgi:hypothetical protein